MKNFPMFVKDKKYGYVYFCHSANAGILFGHPMESVCGYVGPQDGIDFTDEKDWERLDGKIILELEETVQFNF